MFVHTMVNNTMVSPMLYTFVSRFRQVAGGLHECRTILCTDNVPDLKVAGNLIPAHR